MRRKKFGLIAKVTPFLFVFLFLLIAPMVIYADNGTQEIGKLDPTASGTIVDVVGGTGNYVYAVEYAPGTDSNMFLVVDISTPSIPNHVGTGSRSGASDEGRCVDVNTDETVAVVGASSNVYVFDISTKTSPVRRSIYSPSGGTIYDIEIVGNLVYIGAGNGLKIINITNLDSPTTLYDGTGITGPAFGIAYDAARNVIYVACGNEGVKILSLYPDGTPQTIYGISLFGYTSWAVEKISDTRITVGDSYGYLYIINSANLDSLSILGSFDIGSEIPEIVYDSSLGNYLLVAEYLSDLNIVSFKSETSPSLARQMTSTGSVSGRSVDIHGNYVLYAAYYSLLIYNLSDCLPSVLEIPGFGFIYLMLSVLLIIPIVVLIKKQRMNIF